MIVVTPQEAVLNVGRSLLFMREINGANRSELIDEMIRRTGLDPTKRLPWCAAFVAWVGYAALRKQWPLKKVAGCVSLFDDALAKGMVRREPAPGAIFLLYRADMGRFAHTGFLTGPAPLAAPGLHPTVEGNTSPDGSRDGTGTFARARRFKNTDRFIHWWDSRTPT